MTPNTIEYSKADNLIYYNPRLGMKIPIAFVPVTGNIELLINSSSPWRTKQLCNQAVSTKAPQDIDDVPILHNDAIRLVDLTKKRVCYFAKVNGVYLRITKVENVGRNNNPSNVLETTNYLLSKMPKDLVRALESIIDNPEMRTIPKFGTYIPLQMAKHIRNVSSQRLKYGVPYIFKFIRVAYTKTCDYRLVREIDNNVVWSETVANCDINGVHVTPRFDEVTSIITDLIAKDEGVIVLSNEIGEILFRAYEASVIEGPTNFKLKEYNSVKHSEPKADISPKVADKGPEVKPLIFDSNIILI